MNKSYKFIFIILVYKDYSDLEECMQSICEKVVNAKIVVVDAFFDNFSSHKIKDIADKYDGDYLLIENKGYSYGNNVGIEYSNNNYLFEYIVISNPDIIIKHFNNNIEGDIIAPKIVTLNRKKQNPMHVVNNIWAEKIIYFGFKKNLSVLVYLGILINKCVDYIAIKKNKKQSAYKIYAAHGAFVLLSRKFVISVTKVYDENMFLFAEEKVLAEKAKKNGYIIWYNESIEVIHKEDGCMKMADFSINNELKKSNVYYYEKYILKREKAEE